MTALPTLTQEYVFFDVDDTLISIKSMLSFQIFWYQRTGDDEGPVSSRGPCHGEGLV